MGSLLRSNSFRNESGRSTFTGEHTLCFLHEIKQSEYSPRQAILIHPSLPISSAQLQTKNPVITTAVADSLNAAKITPKDTKYISATICGALFDRSSRKARIDASTSPAVMYPRPIDMDLAIGVPAMSSKAKQSSSPSMSSRFPSSSTVVAGAHVLKRP